MTTNFILLAAFGLLGTNLAYASFLPEKADCTHATTSCIPGTVCAGRPTHKKCVIPMKEDEFCKGDPFWVCESGLECVDELCVVPKIEEGNSCKGNVSGCEDGTVCAGSRRRKKCVVPMKEGELCKGDPFWVCASGLNCVDQTCKKPTVLEGGSCNESGAECAEGTVCAGRRGRAKCVQPKWLGEKCRRGTYAVCHKDLNCSRRRCRGKFVGRGRSCDGTTKTCRKPSHCVRKEDKKTFVCGTRRIEGDQCKEHHDFRCVDGLLCISGKCTSTSYE